MEDENEVRRSAAVLLIEHLDETAQQQARL